MRPTDDKDEQDDPRARKVQAAPSVDHTTEQTPDEPPAEPGNGFRARLAAKGQDPNAPPEAPPTDVADAPNAPARPPDDDDVEALLLGDRGWGPAPVPTPKLPDLTGWVEAPSLPPEARSAWRRRMGFTQERPTELDPGAALLRAGVTLWVRAAAPWLVQDTVGAMLAAAACAPWGPWVGVGRAARLDAARVALTQLALLRGGHAGAPVHVAALAAGLDAFEVTVRERGGRFPTVSTLTRVQGVVADPAEADVWTPVLAQWLAIRPLAKPGHDLGPNVPDDAVRRAIAEQGLRVAREVARLRARSAGILLSVTRHAGAAPGPIARAVGTIDTQTQTILVGLGALGRSLHQTPPAPLAAAFHHLAALTRALEVAADLAARQLGVVARVLGPPSPPPVPPHEVEATLRRLGRTRPTLGANPAIDGAIQALLDGDTPPPIPGAPACLAVAAIDRLGHGASLDDVLSTEGRALVGLGASGAVELILRAV